MVCIRGIIKINQINQINRRSLKSITMDWLILAIVGGIFSGISIGLAWVLVEDLLLFLY